MTSIIALTITTLTIWLTIFLLIILNLNSFTKILNDDDEEFDN